AAPSRLQTFSISFRGLSFDETPHHRRVAERYGSDHHEVAIAGETDLPGAIEAFAHYSDEPTADAGAVPVWLLSKLTKSHATVALSGEGADELFGGYLTYRANTLARALRHLPSGALRLSEAAAARWPVSDEKISLEYMLKRFLAGCRMPAERAHVYWNGTFSEAEKRALIRVPIPGALASVLRDLAASGERLADYLWFDQRYYLPDDILTKVDRISMAHAVEVRPPFLDHRIVEFAASLPPNLRVKGSRQKILLKDLMRGKLPPETLRRKKVGFDIPAHEWLRGPLRELMADTFSAAAAAHAGLFRFDRIGSLVEAHVRRRANLGYHLWGMMTLFLWIKKWQVQTTPSAETARASEGVFISP
ncbi:MAG TPA: asparagine synthase C-terminal domain-containing protein, partial [Candidatus Sulfopaludibacter sp.]|nr:asparagine synthase C-terminal domain-containing protein [Candidatus Sulfopaludibacter sp.]